MPIHEATRHAPPPVGLGLYWAMRTDWRQPVLLGFAFVALVASALLPWVLWETANQDRAFSVALAAIDRDRFVAPTDRRQEILRSEGGQYHWSILVWERVDGDWRAAIFHAHVDRRAGYLVRATRLEPFPDARERGHRPPE